MTGAMVSVGGLNACVSIWGAIADNTVSAFRSLNFRPSRRRRRVSCFPMVSSIVSMPAGAAVSSGVASAPSAAAPGSVCAAGAARGR